MAIDKKLIISYRDYLVDSQKLGVFYYTLCNYAIFEKRYRISYDCSKCPFYERKRESCFFSFVTSVSGLRKLYEKFPSLLLEED